MKHTYIFKLMFLFALVYSSPTTGQLIQNGGFDNIDPSCGSSPQYGFGFNYGCLGPEWGAPIGTPSVTVYVPNSPQAVSPVSPPYFTYLSTSNSEVFGCSHESFFYNINLEQNKRYQLSFYVQRGLQNTADVSAEAQLEIYATNGLVNLSQPPWEYDCDYAQPSSQELIHIEEVNEIVNPSWKLVSVCFSVSNDYDQIWVKPFTSPNVENPSGFNRAILLIDDMNLDELTCEETTKLTACVEEDDYGHIFLDCKGKQLYYSWDIPSGSTAIVNEDNVLYNASPGVYTVFITNLMGCSETRTFEIIEDCCETCETPTNLECTKDSPLPVITLSWDPVPDAIDYKVTITTNDNSNCGCLGFPQQTQESFTAGATSYNHTIIGFSPCFSWTVESICENGLSSGPSPVICFSSLSGCYEAPGITDHEDSKNQLTLIPKVYPNPSSGELNFELKAPDKLVLSVDIYSLDGRLVKSFNEETITNGSFKKRWLIENQISNGIYFVSFKTNFGIFQEKIVVFKSDKKQN